VAGRDAADPLELVQLMALTLAPAPESTGADMPEPLLTAAQVARILAVRPKRVYELGIPAVRISVKALRWRRSDLEAWLEQRRGVT
jgi:predicted DNA-binding transcriptional regulator AlpA